MTDTVTALLPVRRRALEATALQWTGGNAEAMEEFLGADFDHDPEADGDENTAVRTSAHSAWEPLYAGDWALRTSAGDILRVDAGSYEADWEPGDGPVRHLLLEVRDEDEAAVIAVLAASLRLVDESLAELKIRGRRIPPDIADEVRCAAILTALRTERGHGTAVDR